jgi:hypothetical protein
MKKFAACLALGASTVLGAADAAHPVIGVDRAHTDATISPCRNFYAAGMDEAAIEKAGLAPLQRT